MRTQVGIIGAGPAGLVLARLLQLQGIDSVILELRDREYVERRVRAGILEQGSVDLIREIGCGQRMDREGLEHRGTQLRFDGEEHYIDFLDLTGREVMVYGQQEVVKDLIAQRLADDLPIHFNVPDVRLSALDTATPTITATIDGTEQIIECDYIAGCDGYHGVSRQSVPAGHLTEFERIYPFAWFGILANAAPSSDELIYSHSRHGFALHSLRSPSVVRNYIQVSPGAKADYTDEQIWDELDRRMALNDGDFRLNRGEITDKLITPMRSWVCTPMRYERLFLAGDAAHTVPPTGAKGMNLAIADVRVLGEALVEAIARGSQTGLDDYSNTAVRRVWRAEHFSWWMTSMLHRFPPEHPEGDEFGLQMQLSQLRYVTSSPAAMTSLAENYVGLPFDTKL